MKIAALMSGGVDSSLALKLLKDQGHNVTAFYLKIWLEDELSSLGSCPWQEDLKFATQTCKMLNIPLKIIPLQDAYHKKIVSYTIAETKEGRTPNPDILCNQHIKFGIFFDKIDNEFEKVATGHYAQLEEKDGAYILKRSPDPIKDQTYFLCNLTQKQLSRAMFPIGHLNKNEVRKLAEKHKLPAALRKDSQGICFLGKFAFRDFVKHHVGEKSGNIIEFETNKKIGTHKGHWFYTIGQRQGIQLSGGPWYVTRKNPEKNEIYVSNKYDEISESRKEFEVTNFNWINGEKPKKNHLSVKIRHKTFPKPCTINFVDSQTAKVILEQKDQGIASGQFAVFYEEDICLGGGIIK
jgi:tRNA-5-taurinomethyluridine 2-sulfurtransferase